MLDQNQPVEQLQQNQVTAGSRLQHNYKCSAAGGSEEGNRTRPEPGWRQNSDRYQHDHMTREDPSEQELTFLSSGSAHRDEAGSDPVHLRLTQTSSAAEEKHEERRSGSVPAFSRTDRSEPHLQ